MILQVVNAVVVQEVYHLEDDAGGDEALHGVHALSRYHHRPRDARHSPGAEAAGPYEVARIPLHAQAQKQAIRYRLPESTSKYRDIAVSPPEHWQGRTKRHYDEATSPIAAWSRE